MKIESKYYELQDDGSLKPVPKDKKSFRYEDVRLILTLDEFDELHRDAKKIFRDFLGTEK